MPTVEVDVELSDFETEDLIKELQQRGHGVVDLTKDGPLINVIFHKRRAGQDFSQELDDLIYNTIGRVV
jgi:hypothetical protein